MELEWLAELPDDVLTLDVITEVVPTLLEGVL
jgi:hypothetical protein